MKALNNNFMTEMSVNASICVEGGKKVAYYKLTWSGTGNPLVYAAEALVNGCILEANAYIWARNTLFG